MEKIKKLKKTLDFMHLTSDISGTALKVIKGVLNEIESDINDLK